MVNFQKYSNVFGVGTLNLSQEMSDKMQNESGQFNYIELRKRQKCGQNWPFSLFFWHFGRFLWTEQTYWHESFKILSGIFWHRLRVLTFWLVILNWMNILWFWAILSRTKKCLKNCWKDKFWPHFWCFTNIL